NRRGASCGGICRRVADWARTTVSIGLQSPASAGSDCPEPAEAGAPTIVRGRRMAVGSRRRSLLLFAGVPIVLVAAALGGIYAIKHWVESPPDPGSLKFRECASEVGINWKMQFLTNEQGETFKINLYDHGCGLAV